MAKDKQTRKYVNPSLASEDDFITSFCRLVLRNPDSEDILHWAAGFKDKDDEIVDIVSKILAIGITDIELDPKQRWIVRNDKSINRSVKANENLYKMFQYLYKKIQKVTNAGNIEDIEGVSELEDEMEMDELEGRFGGSGSIEPENEEINDEGEETIDRTKRELQDLAKESVDHEFAFNSMPGDDEESYIASMGIIEEAEEAGDTGTKPKYTLESPEVAKIVNDHSKFLKRKGMTVADFNKYAEDNKIDKDAWESIRSLYKPEGDKMVLKTKEDRARDRMSANIKGITDTLDDTKEGATFRAASKIASTGLGKAASAYKASGVVDNSLDNSLNSSVDRSDGFYAMRHLVESAVNTEGPLPNLLNEDEDGNTPDTFVNLINEVQQKAPKNPDAEETSYSAKEINDYQKDNIEDMGDISDPDNFLEGLEEGEPDNEEKEEPKTKKGIPTYKFERPEKEHNYVISRFGDIPNLFKAFIKDKYSGEVNINSVAVQAVDRESHSFAVILTAFDGKSFGQKVAKAFEKFVGIKADEIEVVEYVHDDPNLKQLQLFFYGIEVLQHGSEYEEIHDPYTRIGNYKAKKAQIAPNGRYFKSDETRKKTNESIKRHDRFVDNLFNKVGDLFR